MYWIPYIIKCRGGSLYTGVTNDLKRRLAAHNAVRGARYTRSRLPAVLLYCERYRAMSRAFSREAAIKRPPRERKLDLIRGIAL
ncbi:MAG: GIY-YIG nuclease family protein [Candidatus Edwardsbacteria bacterium]|nr:GIY-YIG nuclease family protein [Candidatus Edwardsbacteria bacterium]